MEAEVRDQLALAFTKGVAEIFKDNLAFAFIFGSVAKGKEKDTSDIDIFVCSKTKASAQQMKAFNDFYMNLHEEYGFYPDMEYPGEVVDLEFLDLNLDFIKNWNPCREQRKIRSYRCFEAIFWTAVLAEEKMAVSQRTDDLKDMEAKCKYMVETWKNTILGREKEYAGMSLLDILSLHGYSFMDTHRPEIYRFDA